jgi:gliding motility-associated-like protein
VAIYVPNSFTPNGDGLNDLFVPQGIGIDQARYELWVFDRWGNLVFYTNEWGKGWDGKMQEGSDVCQVDTYVWKIDVADQKGKRHLLIGHISLIR